MVARQMFGGSLFSGNSKKTELYMSGLKGDFRGDKEGLLVSDIVERLVLLIAVQRNESFFSKGGLALTLTIFGLLDVPRIISSTICRTGRCSTCLGLGISLVWDIGAEWMV